MLSLENQPSGISSLLFSLYEMTIECSFNAQNRHIQNNLFWSPYVKITYSKTRAEMFETITLFSLVKEWHHLVQKQTLLLCAMPK